MADNVQITPGSGETIAADEIAGVKWQRVKVAHGADGSATDVSSSSPLPTADAVVAGHLDGVEGSLASILAKILATPATEAKQDALLAALAPTVKFAAVNASSSGDNQIVAAVSGKRIRVLSYVLIAAGTVNATWRSATTAISGAMPLLASSGAAPVGSPTSPLMETLANNVALNLNLSAAVAVTGHVSYVEV